MTTDFIKQRHDTFHTPRSVVFQLVDTATGRTPVRLRKIVAGSDNEVYCVATVPRKEFIVRIRRFGSLSFEQEAWAMERCRAAGVPVPDILSLTVGSAETGREAMVLSKVEGISLEDLQCEMDPRGVETLLVEAGAVLRKIHSVKVEGFYRRQEGGSWDFPDWERVMDSSIRNRTRERDFILNAGFSPAEFDTMIAWMADYKTVFAGEQPVLNHGDYLPAHIFVKEGRVSGVIDFGDFQGAPPAWDFALISTEEPALDLNFLLRGYTGGIPPDRRFTRSVKLCQVGLQMGYLAHSVKIGDVMEAQRLSKALRKTLQALAR